MAAAPRAPYSLEPTVFPFPALAAMSGRAPLGGPRELAMACFVVARLVRDTLREDLLAADQKRTRAQGARHWLGAATVPPPARTALARVLDCVGEADRKALKSALDGVTTVTANQLDPAARLELGRLAQAIVE